MLGYAYFSLLSTYFDKIIIVFYDKRHKNFSFYQNIVVTFMIQKNYYSFKEQIAKITLESNCISVDRDLLNSAKLSSVNIDG